MKFVSFFELKGLPLISSLLLLKACSSLDVGDHAQEVMRLSTQIKTLQDRIETLELDYTKLKKESQQHTEILSQGQATVNFLESDLIDLKSKNQQQTQELNETRKKVDELKDSNEILSNTNKSLSDRLKNLETELMEAKDEVDDLAKQNQELLTSNFSDELKSDLETTTEDLKEANNQIKELEAIVNELQKTLDKSNRDVDQEVNIKDGWYQTIKLQELEIDKENPGNSITRPIRETTRGPYFYVADDRIKIRGNYTEGLNSVNFSFGRPLPSALGKLTSKDYIVFDNNPIYNTICYVKHDYSGCEREERVSMDDAPPIETVNEGIQFSTMETNYYPHGVVVFQSIYVSRWVGKTIADLPHHTELNYESEEGFFSDPIYSKIKKNDFKSYLTAFIEDAERHGVDLSDIDLQNYDFQIKEILPPHVNSAIGSLCNDQIRILIEQNLWEKAPQFDLYHKMIYVMWHMFGHTILGLDHTCEPYHIMWNHLGDCIYDDNQPLPNYPDIFKWNHAHPNNNWQRAVKDMFSGYKQTKFNCEDTLNGVTPEIQCIFPDLPKTFFF